MAVAANAQTKTLTIDFSKGNEWDRPFIYNVDPIRGKTYSIKDGWKIKFSDGALMDNGGEYVTYQGGRLANDSQKRYISHPGPCFFRGKRTVFAVFYVFQEELKNTGIDIFNENGYQATAVRYYYDYFGLEPKLTVKDGNSTIGYSKSETKQFTYHLDYTNTIAGEDYAVKCTLNQPTKTVKFETGSTAISTKNYKQYQIPVIERYFNSVSLIPNGGSCTLYKIEIDYEPAKYASNYAELLAQYKELEGKYGAAEGEIADLKSSLEVEYANNDALDAKVKQLQADLEKEEADLNETLDDLNSAQMAARKYRSLYKLSKKDLEAMNKAYPGGIPSMYGNPSLKDDRKQVLDAGKFGVYFGAADELSMYSSGYNYKMGLQIDNQGMLYYGTKQGYYITRVDVEYTKVNETDNTIIEGNAQSTQDQSKVWSTRSKAYHASFVADEHLNERTQDPYVKVRGVNITAAPGEKIIITDIKVWTAECKDRWASNDYSMGTDNFFTYEDFLKYGGTNAIGAAIQIDDNTKSGTYDLLGRKLAEPQKGINIVNGKKVLVK